MQGIFDMINQVCGYIQVVSDWFWDFPTNLDRYAAIPVLGNFSLAVSHVLPVILYTGLAIAFAVLSFLRQMKKQ